VNHEARTIRRGGFTLIELLVVVAVIGILLSLLIVGLNAATRAGQSANTQGLIGALSQGLVQFEREVGYLPPVLNGNGDLPPNGFRPDNSMTMGNYFTASQNWYSVTSLATYLVGAEADQGPNQNTQDDGQAGAGFRNPGLDGVWGATINGTGFRNQRNTGAGTSGEGKVFGPYVELDNERLLGRIDPSQPLDANGRFVVYFPGDPGFEPSPPNDVRLPVICDYWGQPIQYFRRNYPGRNPAQEFLSNIDYDGDGFANERDQPSLSAVVRLRPYTLDEGSGINVPADWADARNDPTTTLELETAKFAVFSPGPDGQYDAAYRVDDEEFNRDNLVGLGP